MSAGARLCAHEDKNTHEKTKLDIRNAFCEGTVLQHLACSR